VNQANKGSRQRCSQVIAVMALAFAFVQCLAQAPSGTKNRPSFEAASIKPVNPGEGVLHYTGSTFSPTRTILIGNLRDFIKAAYTVEDFQISGGASWLDQDHYEINAVTLAPAGPDQVALMLQTLLQDRFKLAIHKGTEQLPVYSLVVAKSGSKLKLAEASNAGGAGFDIGETSHLRGSMDTSTIASMLTPILGRTVLDNTGLTGIYKVSLEWTPDKVIATSADNAGLSIFTAIQEQLGLRLESTIGPAPTIVIDHAEKPSPN
jgi:uncharacterized protein (TIGR03435 family)